MPRGQPRKPLAIVACPGLGDKNINPYTWLTHAPMRRLGGTIFEFSFYRPLPAKTDILHVHWPEKIFWGRISRLDSHFSAAYAKRMLRLIDKLKRSGGQLVWTAHNLAPHEPLSSARQRIWEDYFGEFRAKAGLVISLSAEARCDLISAWPEGGNKRHAVIPHPHYRTVYPACVPREEARRRLNLPPDNFILCAIGTIRPSKGLAELIEAFAAIRRPDEMLVVAGSCGDPAYLRSLKNAANRCRAVQLRPGRVCDEEIAILFSAANVSIANFRSILNSGSVMLALSYNRPVCAPASGSLRELADKLGLRWFLPVAQPISPAKLRATIDAAKSAPPAGQEVAPLDEYDPEAISARIYDEYLALVR